LPAISNEPIVLLVLRRSCRTSYPPNHRCKYIRDQKRPTCRLELSTQLQYSTPVASDPHVSNQAIYLFTTWAIPVIIAITFHEAAHGFVAHRLGDDTAFRLGRVTLNPIRHIDPFGTVVLPGMLLLVGAPVLFGYAKPVPVKFSALQHPRRDTILVAAAGPASNIALALISGLAFHLVGYLPAGSAQWVADNLRNALILNVMLAVFNLIPLPPLDGGRILVALLPEPVAAVVRRLEPFGLIIIAGLLILLPLIGSQLGIDLGFIFYWSVIAATAVIRAILFVTGNVSLG
jgi:Zn-dependent protease